MRCIYPLTFRFKPHWVMILITVLSVVLFLRLGFWQLHRASEKKQMIAALNSFAQQKPKLWNAKDSLPAQYQPLVVEGHFLSSTLLLDNQHHQHQFGYDVLTPLLLANGHVIIVDRGFVSADVTRQTFPVIHNPSTPIRLTGKAYYPSDKNWILGQGIEQKKADLAIVERLDVHLMSQFLHKSVYPFIIRLDFQAANGFVREWPVVAMSPERHYGYALQWFAMAFIILIIFIAINLKKI